MFWLQFWVFLKDVGLENDFLGFFKWPISISVLQMKLHHLLQPDSLCLLILEHSNVASLGTVLHLNAGIEANDSVLF